MAGEGRLARACNALLFSSMLIGGSVAALARPNANGVLSSSHKWYDELRFGTGFSSIANNIGMNLEFGYFISQSISIDASYSKALLPNESHNDEINLLGLGLSFVSSGFRGLRQEISLAYFSGETLDRQPTIKMRQESFQGYSIECSLGEIGLGLRYLYAQPSVAVGEYRIRSIEWYPFLELKTW